MTVTLSKAQIEALSVELGRYGLAVKLAPKIRATKAASEIEQRIARLRSMTFKTSSVKGAMVRNLGRIKVEGYANDRYGFSELDYPPIGKRWECVYNAHNWRSGRKLLTYQPV